MMMDDSDDECIAPPTLNSECTKSKTPSKLLSTETKPSKKTPVSARKNKFPDANPQLSLDELKAQKTIDQLVTADAVKAVWSGAMACNYDPPLIGNQEQWMSKPDFAELAGGRVNDFKLPRLNSPNQFSQFTDTNSKLYICPFASMFIRSTGAPPVLYGLIVNEEAQTLKMLILMEGDNKFVTNMQYPIHSSLVNALACQLTMCLPKSICDLNPAITQLLHLCSVHFKQIDMLAMSAQCEEGPTHSRFLNDGVSYSPDKVHTTAIDLLEKYGYLDPETKQPTEKKPTVELVMLQRLQPIMRSYAYDGFASLIKRDESQDNEARIHNFRTNPLIPFNGSTPFSTETNTFVSTLEDALTQIVEATNLLYSWDTTARHSGTRRMTIQDAFSPFFNEVRYNNGKAPKAPKKSSKESDKKPAKKKRRINDDDGNSEDNAEDSDGSYLEEGDCTSDDGDDSEDDDDSDDEDEESGEDSDDGDSDVDEDAEDKTTRKMINRKYRKAGFKNKNVSEEKLVRSERKEAELDQIAVDAKWKAKEEDEDNKRRAEMQERFPAKDGIGGLEIVPDHDSESECASDEDLDEKLERRLKSKKRKKRDTSEAGPSGIVSHEVFQMQQRLLQTQLEFMEKMNKLIDNKL